MVQHILNVREIQIRNKPEFNISNDTERRTRSPLEANLAIVNIEPPICAPKNLEVE